MLMTTRRTRSRAATARPSSRPRKTTAPLPADEGRRRVIVERVLPEIDGGRFPIKRTVGEIVDVMAHVYADGHDVLNVRLQHRPAASGRDWTELPMAPLGNDEWQARFALAEMGTHEYTVEAWVDHFLSWRRALDIKVHAGNTVTTELIEGAALIAAAARRASGEDREYLDAAAALVGGDAETAVRSAAALDDRLLEVMQRYSDRGLSSVYPRVLRITVDRERARFGTWYEMFPRSWGPTDTRSATFAEAARHLPNVAALGFDVVYLPPIHPIGTSFLK